VGQAYVEVEVKGSPKLAQLSFARVGLPTETVRTWSDGFVVIPRADVGAYTLTVQRQGKAAGRSHTVVFGPGRNRLVVAASE